MVGSAGVESAAAAPVAGAASESVSFFSSSDAGSKSTYSLSCLGSICRTWRREKGGRGGVECRGETGGFVPCDAAYEW